MKSLRYGLAAVIVVALLGLCSCSLFMLALDESDIGSIQTLDVGDLLLIRLTGNATTGYEWVRTEPASLTGSPLEIVKEGAYRTLGCGLVGGPGEFVFQYRAMRPGTIALEFAHRRSWDPQDPIDSYFVTVWVR